MSRKFVFFLIAVAMVLTGSSDAEAKKGFYLGLGATYNTIEGDFNDTGGLRNDSEIIILPDINNALGIDLRGGYGFSDAWAIELNLMISEHNGTWRNFKGDVNFVSFSINGKYSFPSAVTTKPFLLFGISGNSVFIQDGAENTATGEIADATLSGPGINLGAGIDQYLSPNVSLSLGVMYRYVEYVDAEGVDQSGTIDHGLDGSGISYLLTTAYHF
jgi:opacity protein-like surface antigen